MKKLKLFFLILTPLLLVTLLLPSFSMAQEREVREGNEQEVMVEDAQLIFDDNNELEKINEEEVIDENTRASRNRYFDLTLERKNQTPFGKYVTYVLTVVAHIDSPRTQILWNTPSTLEARPRHKEFNALESGQEYTFEVRIRPLRAGDYDFAVSVISWQHDTNYTNSISDNVTFNDNLVLQPVSSYYQTLNILRFVLIGVVFIGLIVGVILFVRKYTEKAKKWLTPPS